MKRKRKKEKSLQKVPPLNFFSNLFSHTSFWHQPVLSQTPSGTDLLCPSLSLALTCSVSASLWHWHVLFQPLSGTDLFCHSLSLALTCSISLPAELVATTSSAHLTLDRRRRSWPPADSRRSFKRSTVRSTASRRVDALSMWDLHRQFMQQCYNLADLSVSPSTDWQVKPNSKHWFTTSFLHPLLYLVTP